MSNALLRPVMLGAAAALSARAAFRRWLADPQNEERDPDPLRFVIPGDISGWGVVHDRKRADRQL